MNALSTLNPEQIEAASHIGGPCIVTAVPGSGKCVHGDTWVFSDSMLLSRIRDNKVPSVLGLDDEKLLRVVVGMRKAEFIDSGLQLVLRVETKNGYSLIGTPHHPIAVMKDGLLEWTELSQLKCGDYAAIWCDKNFIPGEIDDKFYLMGLLLGDGYLTHSKYVSFCAQSELSHKFESLISSMYSVAVRKYPDKRRENLCNLYVARSRVDLYEVFGDIAHGACDKYLTVEMLLGDRNQLRSLLRGLFDTDGYAGDKQCELTLCSRVLIEQVHLLLLYFGVFSHKSTRLIEGNEYYRITISGDNYRRFVQNVGFGVSYKLAQSSSVYQLKSNSNRITPNLRPTLLKLREEIRDYKWWDGHSATISSGMDAFCLNRYLINGPNRRNITDESILKIVEICRENGHYSPIVQFLQDIAESLCFSRIEHVDTLENSRKNAQKAHVFDYEIQDTHSFIANGFINHNTRTLTARVVRLIGQGVDPKQILCLTFTNRAANEMRERVANQLGQQSESIWISTFHRLFLAILRRYGDYIELHKGFSIYDDVDQKELTEKIMRMHGISPDYDTVRRIMREINDAREDPTIAPYQGLDPEYEAVAREYVKTLKEFNAIDFSGILDSTYRLFKTEPRVATALGNKFKYVSVDEWQDTNTVQYEVVKQIAHHGNLFVVGDPCQCVHETERLPIVINGNPRNVQAKELPTVGKILSFRNGQVCFQSFEKMNSSANTGYEFILSSGATLKVSENHRVYTTGLTTISENRYFVYLMYRPDLGFRVGTTSRHSYGNRQTHESATRLWILETCDNKENALYEECRVSLTFGVPTVVFNGEARGLNQDRLNKLFKKFGDNGTRVLEHYGQDFNYPLWQGQSIDTSRLRRRVIYLHAHAAKGSQVTLEWTGNDLNDVVQSCGLNICPAKRTASTRERWRIRKFCNNYRDAESLARQLSNKTGIPIIERLSVDGQQLMLTLASSLCVDCYLPRLIDDRLELDQIVDIRRLGGRFVSIEVEDSAVFFNADKVLTHNSIFGWRGAKPENLTRMKEDFDDVREITLPRNYRSTQQILDGARCLIQHNAQSVDLISVKGSGSDINVICHGTAEAEAGYVANVITAMNERYGFDWNSFGILYRTNAQSKLPEMTLRHRGIPYRIYGGFSFFDRKEIKTFLSYLSFLSNPFDTIAFARAISSPKRGVGPQMIGKLERTCQQTNASILSVCKKVHLVEGLSKKAGFEIEKFTEMVAEHQQQVDEGVPLSKVAASLATASGFRKELEDQVGKDPTQARRIENLNEMFLGLEDFQSRKPDATLADYLHSIELLTSEEEDKQESAVTLLTMHSAKGLEFPVVFILGAEKGLIPHHACMGRHEEERRLMYVAMTRAEDHLFINHCKTRKNFRYSDGGHTSRKCEPSPFLQEIVS